MPAPVLQALLVADQVYQDQSTGKFVICGIFGSIHFLPPDTEPSPPESAPGQPVPGQPAPGAGPAPSTPRPMPLNRLVRAGSPYAYVSLTEVHGQRMFEMRYVNLNDNQVVFSFEFKIECRNPLETIQASFPLPPLPVAPEGVFVLELICEGELIGSHRILTRSQSKPQ